MNNKGFAITTILYGILILFMFLLVSMLGFLNSNKKNLDKLIDSNNGARDIVNSICGDFYVSKSDELLVTLNDRGYYKAKDGFALIAYVHVKGTTGDGFTGPVLVGKTADSVAYYTSYYSDTILTYSGTIQYEGVTYYYSSDRYWQAYNLDDTSSSGRVKYVNTTSTSVEEGIKEVAQKLIDLECF